MHKENSVRRNSLWLLSARITAQGLAILFITLIGIPSATAFGLPPLFLVLSIPAAAALLVCILFLLSVSEDRESSAPNIRRASTWIKLTMVLGLAALAFSGA